jgi:hypothetical protein
MLGKSGSDVEFGTVLEALLGEVDSQIEHLKQRRDLLKQMLAEDDPSGAGEEPYILELARRHLTEQLSTLIRRSWLKRDASGPRSTLSGGREDTTSFKRPYSVLR